MLQEGQTVYWKYNGLSHRAKQEPKATTVVKVGRKWAYLNNGYRIDMETLRAYGGNYSSPGRIYLTPTHYENEVLQHRTWRFFRDTISRMINPPKNLTPERMKAILQELFPDETFNFEVQ